MCTWSHSLCRDEAVNYFPTRLFPPILLGCPAHILLMESEWQRSLGCSGSSGGPSALGHGAQTSSEGPQTQLRRFKNSTDHVSLSTQRPQAQLSPSRVFYRPGPGATSQWMLTGLEGKENGLSLISLLASLFYFSHTGASLFSKEKHTRLPLPRPPPFYQPSVWKVCSPVIYVVHFLSGAPLVIPFKISIYTPQTSVLLNHIEYYYILTYSLLFFLVLGIYLFI